MSDSDHTIVEADFARALGLAKEDIRELRKRHLMPGEFELGRRGMCLTPAAAEKLRLACGAPEMALIAPEKKGPEKKEGGADMALPWDQRPVVTLYVQRCPANSRIVEACLEPDLSGDVVRVRVKANVNFIPRMALKAKQEAQSLYVLVGRCPRFRGRY